MNIILGIATTIAAQYIAFSLTNKIISKWEQRKNK